MRDGAQSWALCSDIYSDMISGFQPWWRAKDADGTAGGQLNTAMGLWRSPSEVGLPA